MSGCSLSISQSLSPSLSLSAFVTLCLRCALTPCFLPAVTNSLFAVALGLSFPEHAPSPCLCLVLCLQDYRSAVSLTASKSCYTLPLSLISSLPLLLPLSLCISRAPTVGSLVGCKYPCYISILIAQVSQGPGIYFLHIYFIVLAKRPHCF